MRHTVNGLALNVEMSGSGPPLVLLHGFTGSAATWRDLARSWGASFTTIAVDLIGHGASDAPADPARYRMEHCAADLVALFDRLGLDRPAVLGYSLGGRVALHLELAAPERVGRLILESASPGIADSAERAARTRADEALADSIERDGLPAFVARWERLPLFASQERLPPAARERHRAQRLSNSPLGLANSLRGTGAGAMEPVVDRLAELQMPTLLVVGELDDKYVALAGALEHAIPGARLAIVPDAGHAVHLEQPEVFERLVYEFITRVEVGCR
ncbi:MAG TPA: 2-succinyl-6-hydroxy-2,4-cyclohexadiene-1-carboxylate synthase [Thermomicrobiaceae bacterium]|nr:2-succinyl-6-hydroxy-2,4-cyclohexadiene-1-carboxylate synthase [Thermomicrobiaceae bacterium]